MLAQFITNRTLIRFENNYQTGHTFGKQNDQPREKKELNLVK